MPKLNKIYRFLAATALIAVIANVALPPALASVQYICNTEFTKLSVNSNFGECCSSSSADIGVIHPTADLDEEFCLTEQVCEQELTTVFSEIPVVLPEVPQLSATLRLSGSSFLSPLTNTFTPLSLDIAVPISEPPLFLLNSVFLN